MVDRDRIRREAARKALRPEGFEAVTFECGKDATRHLLFNWTEGAVIDFGSGYEPSSALPDGKRIVRKIMEIDRFLPLVLISDRSVVLDHEILSAVALVLRRPVTTIQLKNALNRVLADTLRDDRPRKSHSNYAVR